MIKATRFDLRNAQTGTFKQSERGVVQASAAVVGCDRCMKRDRSGNSRMRCQLTTGLRQAGDGVATLPTEFTARTATDLLLFHVIANIALTVIGVQRDLRALQAIEPIIGHVKQDHGMQRCWLKGQSGDALHAVLCAAGYNLRWLLRAIVRLGPVDNHRRGGC
jgi:hypothetical protein